MHGISPRTMRAKMLLASYAMCGYPRPNGSVAPMLPAAGRVAHVSSRQRRAARVHQGDAGPADVLELAAAGGPPQAELLRAAALASVERQPVPIAWHRPLDRELAAAGQRIVADQHRRRL